MLASGMFSGASEYSIKIYLAIGMFLQVTTMQNMFPKSSQHLIAQYLSLACKVMRLPLCTNMFDGATKFNQNISSWNTASVANMTYTF